MSWCMNTAPVGVPFVYLLTIRRLPNMRQILETTTPSLTGRLPSGKLTANLHQLGISVMVIANRQATSQNLSYSD
jgi:hypothetical protein